MSLGANIIFTKKLMKKLIFTIAVAITYINGIAQKTHLLQENIFVVENGLNYGYTIKSERTKEVKGEEYDRFEIEVLVTNNSGCNKSFPLQLKEGKLLTNTIKLAEFSVKNATGKRLTSKGAKIEAEKIMQLVKVEQVQIAGNNEGIVNAVIGFGVRNAQTIRKTLTVIVPKGQRPDVTCTSFNIPDSNL